MNHTKMARNRAGLIIFLGLLLSLPVAMGESSTEIDGVTGLIIAPGWDTVKSQCTICHSAKFIIFQKGNRNTWASMIKWMQTTQGLWQFDKKTENTILDYLATNYPPDNSGRRRNLPQRDLPATRWEKTLKIAPP